MFLLRAIIFPLVFICISLTGYAQKHNFISYNIDEGLPQSQVFNILQDNARHLWLATGGGVSRFDGKTFTNYTTDDGLSENGIMQVMIDHDQQIWAMTNSGLNLIKNNKVTIFPLPEVIRNNRAHFTEDKSGKLWGFFNGTVYSFTDNKFVKEKLNGLANDDLSLIFRDKQTNLYLLDNKKQAYRYQSNEWKLFASFDQIDSTTRIMQVYIDSVENAWVVTSKEILMKPAGSNQLRSYFKTEADDLFFRCINFDKTGNLWIGCTKGAFKLKKDGTSTYFNYQNGFSDNWVYHIFPDVEGNVWLATEGSGLFKYTGGIFTSFDNSSGFFPSGVFAVARNDQQKVILGGDANDFCIYDGKMLTYPLRTTAMRSVGYIYCAYAMTDGTTWIGAIGGGLWNYKNGKATRVFPEINSVFEIRGDENKLLFATNRGALIYKNNTLKKMDSVYQSLRSIISLSDDSILTASSSELILLKNHQPQRYPFPDIKKTTVATFEKRGSKVFIGTLGNGILVWNLEDGSFLKFTRKNGLSSDFIYSLRFDNKGQLWSGTGKGVSRLTSTDNFKTVTVRNYGKEQGFTGLECNQNAITVMDDNSVWFGAVKGAYCYHPDEDIETNIAPKLVLQSVKLFSKPIVPGYYSDSVSQSAFYSIPKDLALSSRNNHITFEFASISHKNKNVRYSYFLKGLENGYSTPDQTNFVVYPALPPGSYTFNAMLVDEMGKQLGEAVEYKFTIEPAFYQTVWFKILVVLALLGIVALYYSLRKRYEQRQKLLIQKLRTEEQNKIRIKTAQDFHDEMGNKLARITVLSDILKSKLPANDEAQGIAKKIQDNASLLYQGTKDIIWSLNPKNDNLYFLMMHINDFAVDLFHDTEIDFENININEEFKNHFLPMDYARNIMMICKEALTNILKHSQANKATIEAVLIGGNMVNLTIADNGKGFDTNNIEYGNGLHNIRQRADYLKANLEIYSNGHTGTSILLAVGIPSNGYVREEISR